MKWKSLLWGIFWIIGAEAQKNGSETAQKPVNEYGPACPEELPRDSIPFWLISNDCNTSVVLNKTDEDVEYPGYDGWYNNLGKPELGAVDTPLLRIAKAAYDDGVYKPSGKNRPEPLELSELLSGPIGSKSRTGKNALMVFFGQHVVEEILDAQRPACPPEYINLKIPDGHEYRKTHSEMPVLRTRYDERTGQSPNNPRQQLNEITPFLDGGLIYGTTKAWSNYLRLDVDRKVVEGGKLAFVHYDGKFPTYNSVRLPMANPPPPSRHNDYVNNHETEPVTRFHKFGNPRGNENPFLFTFGVLWFRWHNKVAETLKQLNPLWSDEKIYNEARKWVIASQQSIVVYEWLPQWLGQDLPEYKDYNPNIDPQIEQFFQAAAFRFGHTLVPAGIYLREPGAKGCRLSEQAFRTCNNYWLPENALRQGNERIPRLIEIEKLLMGMAVQLAEEEDHRIVEDLRGRVFGPLEFSRRDLMALNIQRGRDHGLPDYNTARELYNLHRVKEFSHFSHIKNRQNENIEKLFMKLYDNKFDDIDIWIGGIMETKDGPGELFQAIIMDQFQRIRDGDRFWFENKKNKLFTDSEIERLKKLKFRDIILSVTNETEIGDKDLPKNVFKVPVSAEDIHEQCTQHHTLYGQPVSMGNCKSWNGTEIPCWHAPPVNVNKTEECTPLGTYDYFDGSQWPFMLTFSVLTLLFAVSIMIIFQKLQRVHAANVEIRARLSNAVNLDDSGNKYDAYEWIGFSSSNRPAIVRLDKAKKQIQVRNSLGYLTRALDLHICNKIIMFVGHDSHYVMVRVDHNYDLVLKFESIFLRNAFVHALERFLMEINVEREIVARITTIAVLKQAVTMKVRQKKLEQFFRVVFSQAFNIAHSEDEILQIDSTVAKEVIYTELTILEFAEALSMKPDSEFVQKIFNLIDTDNNGFISFREFMDMLVLFLKGTAEDKLKLMFDMYDINGVGHLTREDFASMLRSFMETVNADVTDDELESLIHSMMEQAQLANKETIDLQDFKNILGEFNDKLSYAELEFNINSDGTNKKLHAGKRTIRSKFIGEVKKTVENLYADPNDLRLRVEGPAKVKVFDSEVNALHNNKDIVTTDIPWHPVMKYIANNQLEIFWGFAYTILLFGIFAERFHYYAVLNEHRGLRHITGYGVSITRGSASVMMFAYSSLLVTMCQNTITILRDTVLQYYIPFDSAFILHKYIAFWALIFTLIHVIGHGLNFYEISTQTADDLTCLFRNNFHASHEIPKFHYWVYQTITGVTSILLTIVTGIIYLCAIPVVRRKIYKWFEVTHSLYPIFYILIILHGSGRLIQEPFYQ